MGCRLGLSYVDFPKLAGARKPAGLQNTLRECDGRDLAATGASVTARMRQQCAQGELVQPQTAFRRLG
jgi:hypothetical protein